MHGGVDVTGDNCFIGRPAGNAFSTAPDMIRFAHALSDGRLLSPAHANLMTSGKIPIPPQGNQSDIDAYPDLDWVAVMLNNYGASNAFNPDRAAGPGRHPVRAITPCHPSHEGFRPA